MRALFILGTLSLVCASAFAVPLDDAFRDRSLTIAGITYQYVVYVPANWTANEKWPVILFLHGAGERGDDGQKQTTVGIGKALRQFPERYPAIVVMPQCRAQMQWTDPAMEEQAFAALHSTMKEFNGDPQRVYLTGLSMGGYGTFNIAAKYPGRFAAFAPICGDVDTDPPAAAADPTIADPLGYVALRIGSTPIWIFHGSDDPAVPVHGSRDMAATLRALGGHVHYTEYPGVRHNSWDRAYSDSEFAAWLFQQKLKQ